MEAGLRSPNKAPSHLASTFKVNTFPLGFPPTSPFPFKEQKEGILKPIPKHIGTQAGPSKDTKDSEVKEDIIMAVNKTAEPIKEEEKESNEFAFIESVYPGGDQIRVTKKHLKRILKRRQSRRKISIEKDACPIPRPKHDGPLHDSRSKFAKKRPRDQNGRFYTKAELEDMRKQHFKDAVLQYLRCHTIPQRRAR